jgi:hypothetical protein
MADDTKNVFRTPQPMPIDTSPAPSIVATAETRIKSLIAALHTELHAVEGEASEFLLNARKHIANVSLHAHAHFERAKNLAALEAAKAKEVAGR